MFVMGQEELAWVEGYSGVSGIGYWISEILFRESLEEIDQELAKLVSGGGFEHMGAHLESTARRVNHFHSIKRPDKSVTQTYRWGVFISGLRLAMGGDFV